MKNNIKIINVKKRPWYKALTSIDKWEVTVEYNGNIKKYNCWADIQNPSKSNLIWSLKRKITDNVEDLIGEEIDLSTL
jgi:hypothetical protein